MEMINATSPCYSVWIMTEEFCDEGEVFTEIMVKEYNFPHNENGRNDAEKKYNELVTQVQPNWKNICFADFENGVEEWTDDCIEEFTNEDFTNDNED